VQVRGGLEEEIRVRIDPFRMAAQKLDPALVPTRLAQENLNASGGLVREGSTEYLVRTLNEFRDVNEIADLVLERRNGAAIRIRDVGTVERTHREREVVTRLDGGEAVEIAIYREAGANIVELVDAVRAKVLGTEAQRSWWTERETRGERGPPGWMERDNAQFLAFQLRNDARIEVLSDQSTFIRDSIKDVQDSAWIGGLLTVFVIWLALRRFAPTLVIALSIPISVIVTFAPMQLYGVSLNIMSLGGLALGIGMIVDASIVVLESVMRRRELGDSPLEAAVTGTREVAGAVVGSTLTSIAVFAPIVFVHGVAGRVFGDQALTVVVSLLVSLVVAVLFIPVLAGSRFVSGLAAGESAPTPVAPETTRRHPLSLLFTLVRGVVLFVGLLAKLCGWIFHPLLRVHDWLWARVEAAYPRLLGAALDRPWLVVLVSMATLAVTVIQVPKLGVDLLPEIHQGEFTAKVQLDAGTPLSVTDTALAEIDAAVRKLEGVELTALVVGIERDALTTEAEGKHTARLTVRLQATHATPAAEELVLERVRDTIAAHPAVRGVQFTRPTPFALEAPVEVEVLGWNLEDIRITAEDVARRLSAVEGLSDVRTSLRTGNPEARIVFDREKTLEQGRHTLR
jgi:hydrophobic/amphiphilic exporter-1 (mainly G- bacteria), HAE1 family